MTPDDLVTSIHPDTKDWTWVLQRRCPECAFVASELRGVQLPAAIRSAAERWADLLARPGIEDRPEPAVWSALGYMCHVRDVCRVFGERVQLMLTEDDPSFPNWDQDAAAVQGRYGEQDPAMVADQLTDAARADADLFAAVTGEQWQRTGVRSNGSRFTVETLGQYFVHDIVHHLHDVDG
jgi:hypothetical protein